MEELSINQLVKDQIEEYMAEISKFTKDKMDELTQRYRENKINFGELLTELCGDCKMTAPEFFMPNDSILFSYVCLTNKIKNYMDINKDLFDDDDKKLHEEFLGFKKITDEGLIDLFKYLSDNKVSILKKDIGLTYRYRKSTNRYNRFKADDMYYMDVMNKINGFYVINRSFFAFYGENLQSRGTK